MARRSRKDRGALRGRGAARSPRRHPPVSAISLYVHVPFCAARCPYCDFATAPATSRLRSRYLDALATEIGREGAALDRPSVRTLYVGGGTPSLLEPNEIASLAGALRDAFDLALEEATVEANPATLDRARLLAWRALGITRVSLGAQSLNTAGLRALGRTHQAEDTAAAVEAIRSLGLALSLDLIFGWPGQTADAWRADLRGANALRPDHLSCYPLELNLEPEEAVANWPGGGWESVARWRARGQVPPGQWGSPSCAWVTPSRASPHALGCSRMSFSCDCCPRMTSRHDRACLRRRSGFVITTHSAQIDGEAA